MYIFKNKALTLLFVFPMLWGCSTQPEDIKISELSTVCEYSEAVLKVCNKINDIANGRKPEELTDEEKEAIIILNNKFKDLDRAMAKKFTVPEFKECPEFEAIKKLMEGPVDPFI